MPSDINKDVISKALSLAHIEGFSGEFEELGGGEVNDTFLIHLEDKPIVLRITKDKGLLTLPSEARSLKLLNSDHIPRLIYFDDKQLINERNWILESYVTGKRVKRLNKAQYYNLGKLLAEVHKVSEPVKKIDLLEEFLYASRQFGGKDKFINHQDPRLRQLIIKEFDDFKFRQPAFDHVKPHLAHIDVTPSNILVDGDKIGLIDWEFSKFIDPMIDFSTHYYEDMELNNGKWRIRIGVEEKEALFSGYESNGGHIFEGRIKFWTTFDKLGAAVFLYWRINESSRPTSEDELAQYKIDYDNLLNSLEK